MSLFPLDFFRVYIRSRMVRLARDSTPEEKPVLRLLQYRLSSDEANAKAEWADIVEGTHHLWMDISEPYKETIRAFLVHFHCEVSLMLYYVIIVILLLLFFDVF